MEFDLPSYLGHCCRRVETYLDRHLPAATAFPQPLFEAMRYSLFAGGKRIRPAFAFAAAEAVGGDGEAVLPFAAGLEMIHTYSLIHDDLPAMDDDDLRRGKPTCHKVFGEGTAILAGDGLLTDAFAVVTAPGVLVDHPAERVARIVHELAVAAGSGGMVSGQALDLEAAGRSVDVATLEFLHTHKTGALIRAAVRLGGLAAGAGPDSLEALTHYAARLGLAFQIADDVLDVEGSTVQLGKPVGSDQGLGKATYPALLGMEESKRRATQLMDEALGSLEPFGPAGIPLAALARFVVERTH
ncbi:MAG: polyprenyl synthetase family protein [Deferrisomatales bacterium]|nr:polyprenyl synthetase family protein [Deferrisomatales bacterium]